MRKLATIREISEIQSIPDADSICAYRVDGWWVVDTIGKYEIGQPVIYCEIDSWIPTEVAPFLSRGQEPRVFEDVRGERLRTMKLRGFVSQGLLLNYLDFPEVVNEYHKTRPFSDDYFDVTEILGILKYEAPIPAQLAGEVVGMFPSFIPKTDQERIQNLENKLTKWKSFTWEITEKLEGASMTVYVNDDDTGVCSRGLNLRESDSNSLWKVAKKYDLFSKIRETGRNLAIQGEIVGEGIQGNIYKLKGQDFYVFDIYDISTRSYLSPAERHSIVQSMGIKHVPVIDLNATISDTMADIIAAADGKSVVCSTANREGIVFKSNSDQSSFKAISNRYLLKNGD